jgi:hypothetical protein
MKGHRVGGGECAQMVTEALRASGGEFIRNDGNTLDYVWSNTLLTKVSVQSGHVVYSNPSVRLRPGDILQYTNTQFSDGKSATHHTSVVAAVDSQGRLTAVYEQNVGALLKGGSGHARYVVLDPLNLSTLTGGYIKIYRPDPHVSHAGRYEFTIVNNTNKVQSYTVKFGSNSWANQLDVANTQNSYSTSYYSTSGSGRFTITVGKTTLTLGDEAGYEIYTDSHGAAAIRRLNP